MNASKPELFIGMPVFNGARYLASAIESVLAQRFKDFRLVISDNASTDGTAEICQAFVASDPRVSYIRQPRTVRSTEHFLRLLRMADAPYFMWAACDDIWDPGFAEVQLDHHRRHPEVVLTFSPYALVDEGGTAFGKVRRPDYSGRTAAERIARLCHQWDDGVFYGIFKREVLDRLEFPTWWGRNREIPLNVAYPPLCYVLGKGDYALVGQEPMWFNRQHATKPYRETLFANALLESGAYMLRQVNLESECVRQVYRATGSSLAAAEVVPAVGARVAFDVGWRFAYFIYSRGRSMAHRARNRS